MKRFIYGLIVAALCGCTVNQQFVSAVDRSWKLIGPEYTAYVLADENLQPESKATRIRTAKTLSELLEEAKQ